MKRKCVTLCAEVAWPLEYVKNLVIFLGQTRSRNHNSTLQKTFLDVTFVRRQLVQSSISSIDIEATIRRPAHSYKRLRVINNPQGINRSLRRNALQMQRQKKQICCGALKGPLFPIKHTVPKHHFHGLHYFNYYRSCGLLRGSRQCSQPRTVYGLTWLTSTDCTRTQTT